MKQAFFVAFLLLHPLIAEAQTGQPQTVPSRSEIQAMQNEIAIQLQAKLQFEAQVIDLTARIAELQVKLESALKAAPPPEKKN
jgi:hypothetical protein